MDKCGEKIKNGNGRKDSWNFRTKIPTHQLITFKINWKQEKISQFIGRKTQSSLTCIKSLNNGVTQNMLCDYGLASEKVRIDYIKVQKIIELKSRNPRRKNIQSNATFDWNC